MLEVVYVFFLGILFFLGDVVPPAVFLTLALMVGAFAIFAGAGTAMQMSWQSRFPLSWLAIAGFSTFIAAINLVFLAAVISSANIGDYFLPFL